MELADLQPRRWTFGPSDSENQIGRGDQRFCPNTLPESLLPELITSEGKGITTNLAVRTHPKPYKSRHPPVVRRAVITESNGPGIHGRKRGTLHEYGWAEAAITGVNCKPSN